MADNGLLVVANIVHYCGGGALAPELGPDFFCLDPVPIGGPMNDSKRSPDSGSEPATSVATQHRKLGAFISYSRDDLDFADQLEVALRLWGFDTTLDRHAISGGEEW